MVRKLPHQDELNGTSQENQTLFSNQIQKSYKPMLTSGERNSKYLKMQKSYLLNLTNGL